MEWDATPRCFHVARGARGSTARRRSSPRGDRELSFPDPGDEGTDSRTTTRGSGTVGVSWLAWGDASSGLWLFADYRELLQAGGPRLRPRGRAGHPEARDGQQLRGRPQEPSRRRPLRVGAHRLPDGLREPGRLAGQSKTACRSSSTPARSASRGSSWRPGRGSAPTSGCRGATPGTTPSSATSSRTSTACPPSSAATGWRCRPRTWPRPG